MFSYMAIQVGPGTPSYDPSHFINHIFFITLFEINYHMERQNQIGIIIDIYTCIHIYSNDLDYSHMRMVVIDNI